MADSDRVIVFTSDGRYLVTFKIDGGVFAMVFDDKNGLWLVQSDYVSKYTVNLP